jgi:hypothetical protein
VLGVLRLVHRVLPPMPRLDRRARWLLAAIVGIGAVLRLAWVIGVAEAPRGPELHDPVLYLVLAENVADGQGYSYGPAPEQGVTAFYPPGYPLTLGAVLWLLGLLPGAVSTFGVMAGLNVVLSVATIGLVFELGRRLVSVPVGLVAAGVFAIWPNLIVYTGVALTETLFLFLFALMLLVVLASAEVARATGRLRLVTVGLLFGYTAMVRPISLVLAPLFLLLWWRQGAVVALKRTVLVGAALLVVILPWTVRNAVRMDSPVLISTNMGDNLCIGNHPGAGGGYEVDDECALSLEGRRPASEIERQDENLDLALSYIREDPVRFVAKMPSKLRWTLDRDTDGLWGASDYGQLPLLSSARMDLMEWLSNAYYGVVAVVGLGGVVILWLRQDVVRRRLFLVLAALVQLVPPLVTFGDARFKMPIYPALAVAVGVAVVALVQRRLPDHDVLLEPTSRSEAPGPTPEAEPTEPARVL